MDGYRIEKGNGRVVVTFGKAPPEKTRQFLQQLGYRYNARWKCYIGKGNEKLLSDVLEYRAKEAKKHKQKCNGRPTLCWGCKNAIGGCDWSRDWKPVDGWTARETRISSGYTKNGETCKTVTESYLVIDCPEFAPG